LLLEHRRGRPAQHDAVEQQAFVVALTIVRERNAKSTRPSAPESRNDSLVKEG
jgi:hypothetical protein